MNRFGDNRTLNNKTIETDGRFLASTMHEVRTPIQTIISTTELLAETLLNKEQLEYVRQIEFSANVLLQLANDVLDYTKISLSDFKLENIPFDVINLTENVTDLISIEGFSKHLEIITNIDYTLPKIVTGDPTRVQQVLLNLAKNAVKFTDKGYIQISMRQVNDRFYFEVMDSGIGVAKDKQALVFNSFYQVDASMTRRYGGTGLGLSICKNLVDIMHGEIGMRDNPSGGSIFYFSLPLEVSDFNPEKSFTLDVPPSTKMLIVDDNSLSLMSLEEKMHSMGLKNVDTAASGKDALIKLSQAAKSKNPYTIAFIDMIMPNMDGWRLAGEITKNVALNNLKLYLMVPEGQMGGEAKMKLLNWFNGYIYKPIKRTALLNTLEEAFSSPLDLQPIENDTTIFDSEPKDSKTEQEQRTAIERLPPKENPIPRDSSESELAAGLKILIAEDHPVNRKIMETFLNRFGAEVFSAEDGQKAIETIHAHPDIDMIFMDILMPVKSGLDATIELRKNNYQGIIIACTANNDNDDFAEYRKQGINDIMVKPFKKQAIHAILEKWTTILSLPDVKSIMTLATLKNEAENIWDVSMFMESVNNDNEKARHVLQDFFDRVPVMLQEIRSILSVRPVDFKSLEEKGHQLYRACSVIKAKALCTIANEFSESARIEDIVATESADLDFSIDFVKLKNVSEPLRTSALNNLKV